jgi:transposase
VLIGVQGKEHRRRLTILNTLDDFQRLSATIASDDLPVRIGFEAIGNDHRTLAHHLGQAGFELSLVSAVGLARTREALHNSWDKNDPRMNQTGFIGEQKAWKIDHDQRKSWESLFRRSTGPRSAVGA